MTGGVMLPEFSFASPEHGWMFITVSFGKDTHSFDVSDATVDSLNLLVTALLKLLSGSRREEVEWSLEPEWLSWHFEIHGDQLELQISSTEGPNSHFIISAEKTALIGQVAGGLRVLEEQPCWTQPRAGEVVWSWLFPGHTLHNVLGKLRNSRRPNLTVE
jgi:hypothetical protein